MNLEFYDEYDKYHNQYISAIYWLLDANPNIKKMIYPLSNLIHQLIENEIKMYIAEQHIGTRTYEDFHIENTHKIDNLLNHSEFKKYYDGIDICEEIFSQYRDAALYFYNILGDNTFEKSRYPIKGKEKKIPKKEDVDFNELYNKWTEYCILSQKMMIIYMAYCLSNLIIKLKVEHKVKNELEENKLISDVVEKSLEGITQESMESEKKELYSFIKLFVKRNKYYDEKYVC